MSIPGCHSCRCSPSEVGRVGQSMFMWCWVHIDLLSLHGVSGLLLKEDLSSSKGGVCCWSFNRRVDFKGRAQFEFGTGHRFCVKLSANSARGKYWLSSGPYFSNFSSVLLTWWLLFSGGESLAQIWGHGLGVALWACEGWGTSRPWIHCWGVGQGHCAGTKGFSTFVAQVVQGHICWNDVG